MMKYTLVLNKLNLTQKGKTIPLEQNVYYPSRLLVWSV
jgi:hypothetical protein